MIAAPAVDLRRGRCVQLVGGRPEYEAVSLPDPVAVAERWWEIGFGTVHLVDLDAALGDGDNLALLEALLAATQAETQVGGGIRDDDRADALIAAGADRIIVGTRALEDPAWLVGLTERHPARVMVALDTRDGRVLSKGSNPILHATQRRRFLASDSSADTNSCNSRRWELHGKDPQ